MKRSKIRVMVVLGVLAVAGLLTAQLLWLKRAYEAETRAFDFSVQSALTTLANELLPDQESAPSLPPVRQLASNFFVVELERAVDPQVVDQRLREELSRRHLLTAYEWGLLNADRDTLALGHFVPATGGSLPSAYLRNDGPARYNLALLFPDKRAYLVREMDLWLLATVGLLLVVGFFGYTMVQVLREKRLSEMKTDFINNLTHELKTPITNIGIASELMEHASDVAKQQQYAGIITRENQRLRAQVERVLQMAALEQKELALDRTEVDLHAILGETLRSIGVRVQQRAGQVLADLNASRVRLVGDPLHLSNAFFNLLDNAEKYSPAAPQIAVTTQDYGHGVLVTIADQGRGIRKEDQPHIFEKFYRVPTGNTHDVKGFGLGLSYVKSIIDAHRGTITLDSDQGRGSRFELFFPTA
ncbi:two-component system, OmpR family, phosphate regulon sensor histidine kinase PhoR [Catalinimonas alkaloidigena]|uniref:histidine kinase n=1 Tax=Catalinimonas alkaloidigena TaxID=1075417 RepID=A0A1G9BQ13_9BACT|nr:HAMP domain-containing sensor histidine kinase [Catalinimonas alkaloidigena]SDK41572.1 two-component system, OmpR family, phosphate regulon sensor histidine kinase PhoR [Catalinimonas alkaloidigena]